MRFTGRLLELQLGSLASCDLFEVGNLLQAFSLLVLVVHLSKARTKYVPTC